MNQLIKKAVIPAAGLGTRFLPVTKSIPKEMIPIIDKPMLHYIVEEAVNSGIHDVVLISARNKESIEQYFVYNYELEDRLMKTGKEALAKDIKKIADSCNIIVVYQKEPLGLGHAVGCAKSVVGNDPFAILLGDDLIDPPAGVAPCTKQLSDIYSKYGTSVVGVMEVAAEDVSKYGIVGGDPLPSDPRTMKVSKMIEKPKADEAPSRFAIPGRYVLDAEIFKCIENTKPGANGEIQLTDALMSLARSKGLLAHQFQGDRYDTGDRLGYLDATLTFGLRRPELKDGLAALIRKHAGLLSTTVVSGALLLGSLFSSIAAHAYVLPATFIVNHMVEERESVKRIELVGKITDLRTQQKMDEVVQVDFQNEKVKVILTSEDGRKMNQKETTLSQLTPLGLAWLGLGFDSNADRVRSYLDKLEVQIKSHDDLHLGRVNLRPVWEWGTPGTIQIEKDEFLLAGYFNSNAALAVETFTAPGASVRFPKVVRFKRAGADLYLYELKKYKTNSFNPQPNAAKTSDPLLSDRGNEWLELLR